MTIQGVYEYCIGTNDPEPLLRYWAEFGYHPVAEGRLERAAAQALYGVDDGLTAWRLQNGDVTTHGLIRLMAWDSPARPGLALARPLSVGSRWITARTDDIVALRDAYLDDLAAGQTWLVSDLVRQIIREGQEAAGFYGRFVGVREMMVVGPYSRQVFFQRYGYEVAGYGTVGPTSPLRVSEATHGGIVVPDLNHLEFYTDVLGLKLEKRETAAPAQPTTRSDTTFNGNTDTLGPLMRTAGETYQYATLVTPAAQVGRLYVIAPQAIEPDLRDQARPGVSGLGLATYRVTDLADYWQSVSQSEATSVTPILPDEFGQPAFTFIAPDGTSWGLVGG